jgi:hypothetical protein
MTSTCCLCATIVLFRYCAVCVLSKKTRELVVPKTSRSSCRVYVSTLSLEGNAFPFIDIRSDSSPNIPLFISDMINLCGPLHFTPKFRSPDCTLLSLLCLNIRPHVIMKGLPQIYKTLFGLLCWFCFQYSSHSTKLAHSFLVRTIKGPRHSSSG